MERGINFAYRVSLCSSLIPFKTMVHFTWSKPRHPKENTQIQTVDLSTAFCSHGSWSFTTSLLHPVQKIKTKFLVRPYFSVRNNHLIRPPFLFTFRVALAVVWNAIQPDEVFFSPHQVECCITYRVLILCPYQLQTSSSTVFHWPLTHSMQNGRF